jgi:CheY-like chemotaxis protein
MPSVLICAGAGPVSDDLHASAVWRGDVERHTAPSYKAALSLAVAAKPNLVVIDRDMPRAEKLLEDLRGNPQTQGCSIVIVAAGDSQASELGLLETGANAILRHPPGPDWEERLGRLLHVPVRRQIRLHVDLEVEGMFGTEAFAGRVLNLSRTGMLVECEAKAAVGDELRFRLHLTVETTLDGSARVVRMAGANRYGCEFSEVQPSDAQRIDLYLQQLPPA